MFCWCLWEHDDISITHSVFPKVGMRRIKHIYLCPLGHRMSQTKELFLILHAGTFSSTCSILILHLNNTHKYHIHVPFSVCSDNRFSCVRSNSTIRSTKPYILDFHSSFCPFYKPNTDSREWTIVGGAIIPLNSRTMVEDPLIHFKFFCEQRPFRDDRPRLWENRAQVLEVFADRRSGGVV